MSAGRRGLLLSVVFLAPALWLCAGTRAHAQPMQFQPGPGRHSIWQQNLSPDQVRALLGKFGQDDGKGDWFEDLIREAVQKKNPGANKEQVDAAIKRMMADKEFMNRVMDMAQKQKNLMPNNGNGGNPPPLTKDQLEKLAKLKPDAPGGDPFKVGALKPGDEFPQWDPRNPQFDPKKFPTIDPKNPPRFDPKNKFPLDDMDRPFDPRNGDPIDPRNPPRIDPPPPQFDPTKPVVPPRPDPNKPPVQPKVGKPNTDDQVPPPKVDPKAGRPVEPDNNPDKPRFDPDNPLGVPNESPEKMAKTKAAEAATALWEKNVGPIEESPAVRRAIIDLVSDSEAMDALTDDKGNNFFDFLQNGGDDADRFGDLMGGGGDSSWEWPKLDLNWSRGREMDFDPGTSRPRERSRWSSDTSRPRGGTSAFDGLGGFNLGGMTVPWLLILFLLALVVAAVVWWKWADIVAVATGARAADAGPAPWPIDPRAINSREDVVKAFEFLSVLLCGPAAKTWTHSTIADELSALAATHGETAVKLARLYELARYAPLDEPLTRAELLEARRLACDLAGVDEA